MNFKNHVILKNNSTFARSIEIRNADLTFDVLLINGLSQVILPAIISLLTLLLIISMELSLLGACGSKI